MIGTFFKSDDDKKSLGKISAFDIIRLRKNCGGEI